MNRSSFWNHFLLPDIALKSSNGKVKKATAPGALEAEYTITCELPSDKVGLLIGKRDLEKRDCTGAGLQHLAAQMVAVEVFLSLSLSLPA